MNIKQFVEDARRELKEGCNTRNIIYGYYQDFD